MEEAAAMARAKLTQRRTSTRKPSIVEGVTKDIVEGSKKLVDQGKRAGANITAAVRKIRKHVGK